MFAVLGATGKVGWATVQTLREATQPVRAIIRDPSRAAALEALGCEVSIADLHDADALAGSFDGADFVQVICPPAPQAEDAAAEMRRTIDSLAQALTKARPEAALAISDYGAEVESGTGISVLFHELEARLNEVSTRPIFLRSAEHMENWSRVIPVAAGTGGLPSLHHPLDKPFPTISARDVGVISANLLQRLKNGDTVPRILHAEGPRRYTPVETAQTLAMLLGREVTAVELPRSAWHQTLRHAGLSDSGAALVTELYDAHNRGLIDVQAGGEVLKGTTELMHAFRQLPGKG